MNLDKFLTSPSSHQIKQILTSALLGIVIFIGVFGVSVSMQHVDQGSMSACLLMGETTSACAMNVADHLLKWAQLFTSIVKSDSFGLILITLMGFWIFLNRIPDYKSRSGPVLLNLWPQSQLIRSRFHNPLDIGFSEAFLRLRI